MSIERAVENLGGFARDLVLDPEIQAYVQRHRRKALKAFVDYEYFTKAVFDEGIGLL